MAAASRGWVALIGLLAITITANAAAYFLVLAIRNANKPGGISIRTPFLSVTSGVPHNSKELNNSTKDDVSKLRQLLNAPSNDTDHSALNVEVVSRNVFLRFKVWIRRMQPIGLTIAG